MEDSTKDNRSCSADSGSYGHYLFSHILRQANSPGGPHDAGSCDRRVARRAHGSALVLRDQGWDVDVLERSPNPLEGRGTGIVVHPTTVRYLVVRAGISIEDIGLPAHRLRYLDADGSIADERPCAYRFASYFELYRGLLDALGNERYHLANEVAHLSNRDNIATLALTDGQTLTADLVVSADDRDQELRHG